MATAERRDAELLVVVLVLSALYFAVVGPAIGTLVPGLGPPGLVDGNPLYGFPFDARGGLLLAYLLVTLVAYAVFRARLAGETVTSYWSER